MGRNLIESIMGAVVLVVAALFMIVAYNTVSFAPAKGYELTANFLKVGGLQRGHDVRIAGIKVGTVVREGVGYGNGMITKNFIAITPVDVCRAVYSDSI